MVEKETVDIATGEVGRERWYLLVADGAVRPGVEWLAAGPRRG